VIYNKLTFKKEIIKKNQSPICADNQSTTQRLAFSLIRA